MSRELLFYKYVIHGVKNVMMIYDPLSQKYMNHFFNASDLHRGQYPLLIVNNSHYGGTEVSHGSKRLQILTVLVFIVQNVWKLSTHIDRHISIHEHFVLI